MTASEPERLSFPAAFARAVRSRQSAVAVVCDDKVLSFDELDRASNRMARAYQGLGVGFGDLVTVRLPNGVEWFVACMATWKLGAVPNPVSPALPVIELRAIVEKADPKLIVGLDQPDREGRASIPADYQPETGLSDGALPDRTSPIERALTSGGSTGVPKIICARTPAVYEEGMIRASFAARTCALIPGPLYHGIPYASSWQTLLGGGKVVVMSRFDASRCLELIEENRVDRVSLVPTMMVRIARLPEKERLARDLSSIEFVLTSGSPCPPWVMRFWIEWLGPNVMHETFGSTERLGGTAIDGNEWLAHPGSVGRAVGGSRIRILDPDSGAECPPGVMGEIYMMPPAGPGTSYQYRGAEGRRTEDGWESVGDMGCLDDEGYLYLGDRRSDMILCGGRNIFPAEIEAALGEHPGVRSCVVIGLPDEDLGQVVHAIVEAGDVEPSELEAHLRDRLVYYKIPRSFEIVDHPLRDPAGKVRRFALRESRLTDRNRSRSFRAGASNPEGKDDAWADLTDVRRS
jgi:bile acid-coenzyme A ligase